MPRIVAEVIFLLKHKKEIKLAVALALAVSILLGLSSFEARCEELRQNVFRLHIIANSNSEFDQALKLKVRDAVINETGDIYDRCLDPQSAKEAAIKNKERIYNAAKSVINDAGMDYEVEIEIDTAFFDTRHYETFSLPAGEYEALNIRIGEAKGKNWWCVMYPSLCIASSGAEITDVVSEDSAEIANNPQNYVMRFKIVEIYEKLKRHFS
ncbi:MAG: stage II sporulation protein R [Ruminococcaceae bacterium]|nr:stage II sporulation protein R [Oscillospiraceae bacterium]